MPTPRSRRPELRGIRTHFPNFQKEQRVLVNDFFINDLGKGARAMYRVHGYVYLTTVKDIFEYVKSGEM
jgi:hypothetical protein